MTGHGHATVKCDLGTIHAEIRTVNNRGFKCSLRVAESLSNWESKVEGLARSRIHRGSVNLNVSWRKPPGGEVPQIDTEVIRAYIQQLADVVPADVAAKTIDLATLITLPGAIATGTDTREEDEGIWAVVQEAVEQSISNLNEMRAAEGERMVVSLMSDCHGIDERLKVIQELAPRSADVYRERLQAKIQKLLQANDVQVQAVDLLREVQIYADRVDVSEEITRLKSHLVMFTDVLSEGKDEPSGRKLDFIIQEMFRETNTIGSKASDAGISAEVVEVKCAIERMRELVQNLE